MTGTPSSCVKVYDKLSSSLLSSHILYYILYYILDTGIGGLDSSQVLYNATPHAISACCAIYALIGPESGIMGNTSVDNTPVWHGLAAGGSAAIVSRVFTCTYSLL